VKRPDANCPASCSALRYSKTSTVTVAVLVKPPPEASTVILWLPSFVDPPILIVIFDVPAPGAGMVAGLKVTPDAAVDKAIAESKPPLTVVVIVTTELPPRTMLTDEGEAVIVKLRVGETTASKTVVVSVVVPAVPFTVIV
jgi:hypothetical protein